MALRKSLLSSRLPPSAYKKAKNAPGKYSLTRDYSPLKWNLYFDQSQTITVDDSEFRVYKSGSDGPILLLLHGGGFSALTWALLSKEVRSRVVCQTIAIDMRGHGDTRTANDDDLSVDTVVNDIKSVIAKLFDDQPHEIPPIVLIGHSMGGALAVHCGARNAIPNLVGLVVIDVAEGTAVQALTSMQSFLKGRPRHFRSLTYAIEWAYKSGHTRNLESARVSMPGQLKNELTGVVATNELDTNVSLTEEIPDNIEKTLRIDDDEIIVEEDETDTSQADFKAPGTSVSPGVVTTKQYTWRIDLSKTEPHWLGWFQGLSNLFLNHVPAAKLLLLANINGLDTDLTVGQMQGKFQLQVLARCGHAVHEDLPDQVADILASFMLRNQLTTACGHFIPTFPAC